MPEKTFSLKFSDGWKKVIDVVEGVNWARVSSPSGIPFEVFHGPDPATLFDEARGQATIVTNPPSGSTLQIGPGSDPYTFVTSLARGSNSLTIAVLPAAGETVTIGAVTYTFVSAFTRSTATLQVFSLPSAGQILRVDNTTFTFVTGAPGPNEIQIQANVNAQASAIAAAINPLPSVDAVAAGDTVTVTAADNGARAYFQTTTNASGLHWINGPFSVGATDQPNAVLIGGTVAITADNLNAAINAAPGAGTKYGRGTSAHPLVSASVSGGTVTVTANQAGAAGNIPTSETMAGAGNQWATPTLTGGADQPRRVLIGGSQAVTAANLAAAINAEAGLGVVYGAGTTTNLFVYAQPSGNIVRFFATVAGAEGNTYPLSTSTPNITLSAATLTGGSLARGQIADDPADGIVLEFNTPEAVYVRLVMNRGQVEKEPALICVSANT